MKNLYRAVSLLVAVATIFVFIGCQKEVTSENLMENVTPGNVSQKVCDEKFAKLYTEMSIDLMKKMYSKDKNTVISPLALVNALMVAANGADGQTCSEIQGLFGNSMSLDDINLYLHTYQDRLENTKTSKLYMENSIWFNSDNKFNHNSEFIQMNADYYNASLFKDSFSSGALQNINNWISNQTQENLPFTIKELPQDALMYFINAAFMQAEWDKPYSYENVKDSEFTNAHGEKQPALMMTSFDYMYLRDGMIEGFMKYYSGKNYAFVALHTLYEEYDQQAFIDSLSANKIRTLFETKKGEVVQSTMPKFECEFSGEVSDMLKEFGVKTAFNSEEADFGKMGESDKNLYIDDIYTKAQIRVTEKGTGAGTAATISNPNETASQVHVVNMDGPFVYMVVDCKSYLPILIGAVNVME